MHGVAAKKNGQRTVQGTGKADRQEVFSDGTDSPAQAGTRAEVWNTHKKYPFFTSTPCSSLRDLLKDTLVCKYVGKLDRKEKVKAQHPEVF